ncbi:uncharacterized protein LOC110862212 [Folsomia candida]|uniref:uncharacterized protein LOC110862212 n=1 Tax=Folsomia candida TaxID=158441 RepID=UPI000B8F094E|nr:uncharacterized protein LOC110862212 [Folsomia candida]
MGRVIHVGFGLLLVFGVFCLFGDSAPIEPPSWNFLIRKREPPPPVKKVQVEDSLRVPSLDFLVKPTAQDKHSQGRHHTDSDYDSSEYDDDILPPPRKNRPKPPPQSSSSSSWNVFKTSKRAIVNYVKAVKNMFSNGKRNDDDDYRPKNNVQERGDRNPAVKISPVEKIPKTKYGTRVEVDEANRVKAVAIVNPGDEGDTASDTYFKDKDANENDEGLGIGDAVKDLFWGSVYKGA